MAERPQVLASNNRDASKTKLRTGKPHPLDFSLPSGERAAPLLLVMVLVIATAGLVYELAIAAVASYLLGDSVRQFSLIIGVYLSALGLGAFLSKYIERQLAQVFINVELSAALIGGLSVPGLFVAFAYTEAFSWLLYGTVVVVGTLVGLELPLLIRILQRHVTFKELIAKSLTFDYAGALLGSLGFTLVLVPYAGLVRSSVLCGLLNALVALLSTWVLPRLTRQPSTQFRFARVRALLVLGILALAGVLAEQLLTLGEHAIYRGKIDVAQQSAYQRIVLTRQKEGIELYLNGNLQFSSVDEARYHEALVHPALASSTRRSHVLIAGGGDGLAAREVLKWPEVTQITLVDLDPAITDLARDHPVLRKLNADSMHSPRLKVVNQDAMSFLRNTEQSFDVAVLDFPDPSNYSLGKLYSKRFYDLLAQRLHAHSSVVVQASSPLFARRAFWCTVSTLELAGFHVIPYRALVPSFGEWGFALARKQAFAAPEELPTKLSLSYLNRERLNDLFTFPTGTTRIPVEPNRLNTQRLVAYYLEEWSSEQR